MVSAQQHDCYTLIKQSPVLIYLYIHNTLIITYNYSAIQPYLSILQQEFVIHFVTEAISNINSRCSKSWKAVYLCSQSLSYSTVVLYSRDRYEIIGLLKLSHSIKQPCSSVSLKKASEMHQKC